MTRASTYTWLALDRYAKIMGIPPLPFSTASCLTLTPQIFPLGDSCSSLWWQYDWQHFDQVSREQLAMVIHEAEMDLASVVGYPLVPIWVREEDHRYPKPYDHELYGNGLSTEWRMKTIPTVWGKVSAVGQRKTVLLASPTTAGGGGITYTDDDSDGFFETCSISFTTSVTDEKQIRVYFHVGEGPDPLWEIRPLAKVHIDTGTSTCNITLDSWLMIDPDLYEAFPTSDESSAPIDISTTANFVTQVDVYQELVDPALPSCQFIWDHAGTCAVCGGTGCDVCANYTQDGCTRMRNPQAGILAPYPATYDAESGLWSGSYYDLYDEPDHVKVYYRAGATSERYVEGYSVDPLSDYWARTIAYLATARLDRPFCACGNLQAIGNDLQEDLSMNTSERQYFNTSSLMENPLGTRRGEVWAWKRVSRLVKDRHIGVTLV